MRSDKTYLEQHSTNTWEGAVIVSFTETGDQKLPLTSQRSQLLAQRVTQLFYESFREALRKDGQVMMRFGEQQKWRPVLRDVYGNVVHSPGYVLLNPLPSPAKSTQSELQLVVPAQKRLGLALARPVAYLEHKPLPNHEQQAAALFTRYVGQGTTTQERSLRDAVAQYQLLTATIDPARPQEFRRGLEVIISMLPTNPSRLGESLVNALLRLNPLQRVTYHADIGAVGRQPIEQTNVPLTYKGVALQPRQIRNLLIGNTIEVSGIRDPNRGGLYRAGVSFNILSGRAEEVSRQEQLKTDHRQEAVLHQKLVSRQDDDSLSANCNTAMVLREWPGKKPGPVNRPL